MVIVAGTRGHVGATPSASSGVIVATMQRICAAVGRYIKNFKNKKYIM